ncbi:MAG: COX15/CtaA family protein [Hyphomicrobiales bacterium]
MTVTAFDPFNLDVPVSHQAWRGTAGWVGLWLWAVAGLVIVMVVVGGATRLTGSGLSITEWRPLSGMLPPLSEADWSGEFARYRGSPQYQLLNAGMSLAGFKSIFWWEWGHRQLGRFIGFVFAGGFVLGLAARAFPWSVGVRLAGMGLLLGLQGLIGWVMVASGLKPGMTAVEPVDLAVHLLLAALFLAAVVATATTLGRGGAPAPGHSMPRGAVLLARLLVGLVLLQLVLGALTAGSHAGLIHNSWPTMDGRFVPPFDELFAATPWWVNIFENVTLIQFDHRMLAYIVLALALWNAAAWSRPGRDRKLGRLALALAVLVLAQLALGIVTLLLAVPPAAALGHQFLAMLVLAAVVRLAVLSKPLPLPSTAAVEPPPCDACCDAISPDHAGGGSKRPAAALVLAGASS